MDLAEAQQALVQNASLPFVLVQLAFYSWQSQ